MIKTNCIAQNCRSILRERCYTQGTYELGDVSQQRSPCNLSKPCHSIYGVDHLRARCEQPSYHKTGSCLTSTKSSNNFVHDLNCIDKSTAPMRPILNQQTSHIQYLSIPSNNCIQMITNAIITKIRYHVSQEEITLLRCCLPSLIRQIMCKSPWLTPNDVIRWLSEDIIREAKIDSDRSYLKNNDGFHKSKHNPSNKEKAAGNREFYNSLLLKSSEDDNDSLSSDRSENSEESIISQHSSRSSHDRSNDTYSKYTNKRQNKPREIQSKKENTIRSPSTHSINSRQISFTRERSLTDTSKRSDKTTPIRKEDDEKSISSHHTESQLSINTFDSDENFDQKSIALTPNNPPSHQHIEYPGKKDPKAMEDVEKCLAFYHKIREHFDEDVAAMLLKCCLCYGGCSEKK